MSSAAAPYCKTSAEAFELTHVFPNGYRRVGDERSVDQKLIHLQSHFFALIELIKADSATGEAAHFFAVKAEVTAVRAELRTEQTARQRDVAALKAELNVQNATHAKAIAAVRAELTAERRAKDEAVNRLTAQLNAKRCAIAALRAATTKEAATLRATLSTVRDELTAVQTDATGTAVVDAFGPLIRAEHLQRAADRNRFANKFNGPLSRLCSLSLVVLCV
jgi:chromosome segregation ATPase